MEFAGVVFAGDDQTADGVSGVFSFCRNVGWKLEWLLYTKPHLNLSAVLTENFRSRRVARRLCAGGVIPVVMGPRIGFNPYFPKGAPFCSPVLPCCAPLLPRYSL